MSQRNATPTNTSLNASLRRLRRAAGRKKTALWHQWQQRRHGTGRPSRPAFLVGSGRSGTSMLVLQLGRSWQIDVYNEDQPAAFDHWRLRELPLIEQLVSRSRAPITLFKPILDTYRACAFLDYFPQAKILFAGRHFDDVINSSLKKFGAGDRIGHVNSWVQDDFSEFADRLPPPETQAFVRSRWRPSLSAESGAALFWLFQNRLFFDLGLANDRRVRLVLYESVVTNPAAELAAICDFLEIRFEPQMAAGIFASSIQRTSPPALDEYLRQECQQMWQQLCHHAGAATSPGFDSN